MNRRMALSLLVAVAAGVPIALIRLPAAAAAEEITVYKDPNCGCCGQWVEHVTAAGFMVTVHDTADLGRIKTEFGVPEALQACHTAMVSGYVVEGHVPAAEIKRLLAERPKARGLAVPGMPMGSPGMEQGSDREPYDVVLFQQDGTSTIFARH